MRELDELEPVGSATLKSSILAFGASCGNGPIVVFLNFGVAYVPSTP